MTDDKAIAITLRHSVITFGGIVQTGLGAQTATRIEALTAENERLRGLVRGAIRDVDDIEWQFDARAALAGDSHDQ